MHFAKKFLLTIFTMLTYGSNYGMRLPIVYHPDYNIKKENFGVPFLRLIPRGILKMVDSSDSEKYGHIYQMLCKRFNLSSENFCHPDTGDYDPAFDQAIDREFIELGIHSPEYLVLLHHKATLQRIADSSSLGWVPEKSLPRALLHPMHLATVGTYMACNLALTHPQQWAINLSGGYHHAKHNEGSGFCYFADIPYAVTKLWHTHPELKVMIIDLDAHQGNGNEDFFKHDPRIAIFDVYNTQATFGDGKKNPFPADLQAAQYIRYHYALTPPINTELYLDLLRRELPRAIDEFRPNLIIYNAGTDILEGDPIGGMQVTAEGINQRDVFVFTLASRQNIPIAMVLSGGYTPQCANVMANSIAQILETKGITPHE